MRNNFEDICRRSVQEDFRKANFQRNGRAPQKPHPANTKRIVFVDDRSDYAKFKRELIGKLVRLKSVAPGGGIWVNFVYDKDRLAVNRAAGWSDNKTDFLLDNVKFDD